MTSDRKRFLAGAVVASVVLLGLGFSAGASAPAGRYTLSTDTVTDNVTGLVWQRAVTSTTFTWDGNAAPAGGSAQYYCNHLSLGGIGAGQWRLPRELELESIVDNGRYNPSIDVTAFPNTPSNWFWSASPNVSNTGNAWYVDFYYGSSLYYDTSNSNFARCVH
jgi:hypothetical protein